MDHKTSGPYKYYERPTKGRAEGMKPTKYDRGWKFGIWLIVIILIVLIPVTYQFSAKNLHKTEQATEVQRISKPVKNKKHKKIKNKNQSSSNSSKNSKVKTYVVKDGDTISSIAAQNGMTVAELEQLNGLSDSANITAGQTLKIK